MRRAWTIYMRNIKDYPETLREAVEIAGELAWVLIALTLPVTFWIFYPAYQALKKAARK